MLNKQLLLNKTKQLTYVGHYLITVGRLSFLEWFGYSRSNQFGSYVAYGEAPQLLSFYTNDLNGRIHTSISSTSHYNFQGMVMLCADTPHIIQYDGANYYIDVALFSQQNLGSDVIVALFSYN